MSTEIDSRTEELERRQTIAQLSRNHQTPACNQLNAFLNQVSAKDGLLHISRKGLKDYRYVGIADLNPA
jgi:hypothetical protein